MVTLRMLEEAGAVGAGEAHFARLCAEGASEVHQEVLSCAVAVACRFLLSGHPCIPLAALDSLPLSNEEGEVVGTLPDLVTLRAAFESAGCVVRAGTLETQTAGELDHPLVLDDEDRLYVARFFEHEQRLARVLSQLLAADPGEQLDERWLQERLDHYFPRRSEERDDQREAAARALARPFSVISGGPGTGKTSTVVKILGLYFDDAERRGAQPPTIQLLAPTGKAAARMMEAIFGALSRMDGSETLRAHIAEASTIHRALGVNFDNKNRFRRGADHPLRADVVIVDEASMVDLSLMRHLVESLAPGARLILLGDRHQLASVEAGSVLFELCTADLGGHDTSFSSELGKSYRFSEDSGIFALATALRNGDPDASLAVLEEGRSDLSFHPIGDDLSVATALRTLVVERYGRALRCASPAEVLEAMARFRVLCAHRRGAFGVETVNELVRGWLVEAGLVPKGGEGSRGGDGWYRGRLILITENDYEMGLFNGDVGLIWPDDGGNLSAHFPTDGGELRALSPAQLPAHETAFALTIHKSQGSEHDEVAVVLPHETSPLLTRQLVYTGVTRAKKGVVLFGSEGAVRAAAERSVTRYSGLATALRQRLSMSESPSDR